MHKELKNINTVKPVVETTCIKQSPVLIQHPFFNQFNRPPAVRDYFYYFPCMVSKYSWLVVLVFNTTETAKVISW